MSKNNKKNKGKNKALLIFTVSFLALVLIFGIVLGSIAIAKNAGAVVAYEGVTMDEKVASFFLSRFKVEYISSLLASGVSDADDTEEFWSSEYKNGQTHGARYVDFAKKYLKEVVVAAYLFDRYSSLTSSDKEKIADTVSEVLTYHADGDENTFDSRAETFGFDYDSFVDAAELLYKSNRAFTVIYGSDGAKIAADSVACSDYLNEYSHVKLLFVRTEEKLTTDVHGDEVTVPLDEEEKAERRRRLAEIREAIYAWENNTDGQMTPQSFEYYLDKYGEGDSSMDAIGYYFHKNAAATKEMAEEMPDLVNAALTMELDAFREVPVSIGVCFVYKYECTDGAYANDDLDIWFSDFYSHAAVNMYIKSINSLVPDAQIKERIEEIDILAIPENTLFVPRF